MSTQNGVISHSQQIQVICLPFSGGSAYAFQPLVAYFPKTWKMTTLAYPGRGRRMGEAPARTMEALAEDCWQQIKGLTHAPYVIFGHSLGSTLAYLLAHKAKTEGRPLPLYLFLLGTDGPSVPSKLPHRYLYSKTDFKHKLKSYGGISDEILNDEDAFDFFEPIIRADFQVVETWEYTKKAKLNIPATVITGIEEDMTAQEIQCWQEEFSPSVIFRKMDGHHFFIFKNPGLLIELLQKDLHKALVDLI